MNPEEHENYANAIHERDDAIKALESEAASLRKQRDELFLTNGKLAMKLDLDAATTAEAASLRAQLAASEAEFAKAHRACGDYVDKLNAARDERDEAIQTAHTCKLQLAASEAALAEAKEELAEDTKLREKLADILTRTANALKGPPAKLSLHSWHDLPGVAAAARAREAALRSALETIADGIDEDDTGLTLRTVQKYARQALAAQEAKPE